MSKKNPGMIFDASNSWCGYNHQGKLAILFALREILEVYDNSLSEEENKVNLSNCFIEIEHLEDFSLGKLNSGNAEYTSVHQVKNRATDSPSDYNSALLGLAYHVKNIPSLKNAYLHTTTEIDFKGVDFTEYLKTLITNPIDLCDILEKIKEYKADSKKKNKICEKNRGRKNSFVVQLWEALLEVNSSQEELNEDNIDDALEALKQKTEKQISDIGSLSTGQIDKIGIYPYSISGEEQLYCEVNRVEMLIEAEIEKSIDLLGLPEEWRSKQLIFNRYLILLEKLDKHIIDRNINYSLYKKEKKDRKILLSEIYEWITSEDIEISDEQFYRYKIKKMITEYSDEYCNDCKLANCDTCNLVSANNKIDQMSADETALFLALTCPNNNKKITERTFSEYLTKRRFRDPFFKGIRDIYIPFDENKQAITYNDPETKQYVLTIMENDDDEEDYEAICTDIVKNRELFELLRDYDYFISKNITVASIHDKVKEIAKIPGESAVMKEKQKEHIAHLKEVGIITLEDFEKMI